MHEIREPYAVEFNGECMGGVIEHGSILFALPGEDIRPLDLVSVVLDGYSLGAPGIATAAQALADDPDRGGTVSRYASRGVAGALGGVSVGIIEDLRTIADQVLSRDLKKSGVNAMIRQLPGATLPGVRTAIHVGLKPELREAVEE